MCLWGVDNCPSCVVSIEILHRQVCVDVQELGEWNPGGNKIFLQELSPNSNYSLITAILIVTYYSNVTRTQKKDL